MNEILAERTAFTKIFDVDGHKQLRSHNTPIHYRASNRKFYPVDTRLETVAPSEYAAPQSTLAVYMSKQHAQASVGFHDVTPLVVTPLGLPQSLDSYKDARKTFIQDAYINTDIDRMVTRRGFKQNITLKAPGHPGSFSTHIDLPRGYTLAAINDGSVRVMNGRTVAYYIPAPFLDEMTAPFRHRNMNVLATDKIRIPLKWVVSGNVLTVDISQVDLDVLTYPLTIDPQITPFQNETRLFRHTASTSWTTTRDGNGTNQWATHDNLIGTTYKATTTYTMYRTWSAYTTSSIPDDATVDDATLYLTCAVLGNSGDITNMVETVEPAPPVTTAGYHQDNYGGDTPAASGKIAGTFLASPTVDVEYSAAVDISVIPIDKTGDTVIGFRGQTDVDDSPPGAGINRVFWYAVDYTGTDKDPWLEVNYTEAGTGNAHYYQQNQ